MLPGPLGFTIIDTHIFFKNRVELDRFFIVVHVQTEDDNWNFSLAKFETFGNLA